MIVLLVTGMVFASPGKSNPPSHNPGWIPPGHRSNPGGDATSTSNASAKAQSEATSIAIAEGGKGGAGGSAKIGDITNTATGGSSSASAEGGAASIDNVNNAGATVNTKTTVFVPPSPPSIPGNEFVQPPIEETKYSNVNLRDVDNMTWQNAGALKSYAKAPHFLIFPDWSKFGITVSPIALPENVKTGKVTWFKTFEKARHEGQFDSDEITIENQTYVRVADLSGDAQQEGINQNRMVAAAAYLGKDTGACILVYEVFTNAGNIGESGTLGAGTDIIGTSPMSANVIVGSKSKGISKKVGLPGISGTLYALKK